MSSDANTKLEASMLALGYAGTAVVERTAPAGISLRFTREDGELCGVQIGGKMSETRTEDDLIAIAANKMSEWYSRAAE